MIKNTRKSTSDTIFYIPSNRELIIDHAACMVYRI
jgi:hypothetical protein